MIDKTSIYSIIDFGVRGESPLWETTLSYLPVRSIYVLKGISKKFRDNTDRYRSEAILLQLQQIRSLDINDLIGYSKHISLKEFEADEKEEGNSKVSKLVSYCQELEEFTLKIVSLPNIRKHFSPAIPITEASSEVARIIQQIAKLPKLRIFEAHRVSEYGEINCSFKLNEIKGLLNSKTLEQFTLRECDLEDPNCDPYNVLDDFCKMGNLRKIEPPHFKFGSNFMWTFDNKQVRKVSALKHLHTLNLNHWIAITIDALEALASVKNITDLTLPHNGRSVTNEKLQMLANISHLQGLSLSDINEIEDVGYGYIASCFNLRRLEIKGINLTEEKAKLISNSLVNLISLKLEYLLDDNHYGLTKGEKEAALLVVDNLNLSELGLRNFALTDEFIPLVVKKLPGLTYLDISGSLITSASFAELAKLPNLRELNLTGIQIKPREMHLLATCKNLQSLSLSSDQLDMEHLEKTGFFKSLSKLENLRIDLEAIDHDEVLNEIRRWDNGVRKKNIQSEIDEKLRKLMRSYLRINVTFKHGVGLELLRNKIFRNDRLGISTKNDS